MLDEIVSSEKQRFIVILSFYIFVYIMFNYIHIFSDWKIIILNIEDIDLYLVFY